MQAMLTIALCAIVWLHTICLMKNGGGFISTFAIIATSFLWLVSLVWFGFQDEMLYAWLVILSVPSAFLVVIFDGNLRDGGFIN